MNTIGRIWEESLQRYKELPAVRWLEGKTVKERSYQELGDDIIAVRKGLAAAGFHGAHIALIGTASISWITAYLGITTGDNVAVPLDAGLPAEDLLELLDRADAQALFLSPKGMALLPLVREKCHKIREIWILQEEASDQADTITTLKQSAPSETGSAASGPDDIATIIYTSGTTGKSKGVMLTQANMANNVVSVPYTTDPGTE